MNILLTDTVITHEEVHMMHKHKPKILQFLFQSWLLSKAQINKACNCRSCGAKLIVFPAVQKSYLIIHNVLIFILNVSILYAAVMDKTLHPTHIAGMRIIVFVLIWFFIFGFCCVLIRFLEWLILPFIEQKNKDVD